MIIGFALLILIFIMGAWAFWDMLQEYNNER